MTGGVRLAAVTLLAALAVASTSVRATAQTLPIVRGRVTTDSGAPIPGATVLVTAVPSAANRTATTDTAGAFRLQVPEIANEYVLSVSAVGRRTIQRRLVRGAADNVLIANVQLTAAVASVAAVHVAASRPRPYRQFGTNDDGIMTMGTSPGDHTADGVQGALPPDVAGDLAAIASMIPGLSVTADGGISAVGLGPESNATTLNGMNAPVATLPRDARKDIRYVLSPWDPTRGGASGVLMSVMLSPGSDISSQRVHATLDAPQLQVADAVARSTGQQFTGGIWGAAADGPLVLGQTYYNVSGQLSRRTAPARSILNANSETLIRSGVAPDSAARFLALLANQAIATSTGDERQRLSTSGVFTARIDHTPAETPGTNPPATWWLSGYLSANDAHTPTTSLTATPTLGNSASTTTGALQGAYSTFLGAAATTLNETSTSLSWSGSRATPDVDLPNANVLVNSDLGGAAPTSSTLAFGGNSGARNSSDQWSWDVLNTTTVLLRGSPHFPAKLMLESELDGLARHPAADPLGSFSYVSLADLAANRPAEFTRALDAPASSGGEWRGSAALGLQGRWGNRFLVGGLRADANAFTLRPAPNATVDQTFGVRTSYAPSALALSPRLGFTWYYHGQPSATLFAPPMATVLLGSPQIRAGIGLFRDYVSPALLAGAGAAGVRTLTCIGDAAPAPDWAAYAASEVAVPRSCSAGFADRVDTAQRVTFVGPHYSAPHSWRGMLGWTGHIPHATLSADATYSLNLSQPSVVDANFAGVSKFSLADEGGRPVYVPASAVDPTTGLATTTDARRTTAFGPVVEELSDLRGDARQIALMLIPFIPRIPYISLGYAYLDARSQARGFDQAAGGDPRTVGWAPSALPHHRFIIQAAKSNSVIGATMLGIVSSGYAFTPLVAGDVNGDGLAPDRAFVFDPSLVRDPTRDAALRDLLAGSPRARSCLDSQIGTIVAANSCRGPWSATLNGSVFLFPHSTMAPGPRVHAMITVSNILGGVDQLLHGSGDLRGWGMQWAPDPVLYRVTGFDPSAERFLYEVNLRFAAAGPSTTIRRNPMRISVDVSVDLGAPAAEQELEQNLRIQLPLVGTRAPADSIKRRYMARQRQGFFDPYEEMLKVADTLALSREQVEQLMRRQAALRQTADSLYGELAEYLAALPKRYEPQPVLQRVQATSLAMRAVTRKEGPFVAQILTPGQIHLLPRGFAQALGLDPSAEGAR